MSGERTVGDQQVEQRIGKYRTADVVLTLRGRRGGVVANAPVTVRQVRHKFLFGCNAYVLGQCRTPLENAAYKRRFAGLFNYATLPFYWGEFEPTEGDPRTKQLMTMARWCAGRGIVTKGHPLCWNYELPKWLASNRAPEVRKLQAARIDRDVSDFKGLVDVWDVVNEAVAMPLRSSDPISKLCKQVGRVALIRQCFERARRSNRKALLILNDCDTSPRYEKLIGGCIDTGVEIDAIGIQSHMHKGYCGAERAWKICQQFAKFGKPLHFTEATLLSGKLKTDDDWWSYHPGWKSTAGGERRQAVEATEFYRVLFSHPAVEAITWWDLSDRLAWQGAPAGLLRKDMTPKPAYDALRKLVRKDWWTAPLKLTTDADGRVKFRGFLGEYLVKTHMAEATFTADKAGKVRRTVKI